jgi:hypothetical protein
MMVKFVKIYENILLQSMRIYNNQKEEIVLSKLNFSKKMHDFGTLLMLDLNREDILLC